MEFKAISPQLVKQTAPGFYHKDAEFYTLHHNDTSVGMFSIKTLSKQTAEIGLLIFSDWRHHVLTPKRCHQLLDCVHAKGFRHVIIGTYLPSMAKLCQRFNFTYLLTKQNKNWFKKELAT